MNEKINKRIIKCELINSRTIALPIEKTEERIMDDFYMGLQLTVGTEREEDEQTIIMRD